jgi:hypothetical protein
MPNGTLAKQTDRVFADLRGDEPDMTQFCNDLRATKPVDPAQPVTVAGEPQ